MIEQCMCFLCYSYLTSNPDASNKDASVTRHCTEEVRTSQLERTKTRDTRWTGYKSTCKQTTYFTFPSLIIVCTCVCVCVCVCVCARACVRS